MVWLQVAAVVVGVVCLGFFALFAGYYWRNRRMSLEVRRAAGAPEPGQGFTSAERDDDESVGPPDK